MIPAETVRVARAAFPKGSLAIRVRDELGPLFRDEEFADLFPARGKPAWSPGRLALVLVLQFVEGLTDRQAAEAVRARIDFKYALGLELSDPGFDFSVLSEFRDRLAEADAGRRVLDGVLAAAGEKGLLKTAGRARTDSTHVLTAARDVCWLERVSETLRSALNALAQAAPDWLAGVAEPDWFKNYATRAEDSRFPKSRTARDEWGLRIGRDGTRLLQAVWSRQAPQELRTLGQVEYLRQMWVQNFHQVEGEVRRRDPKDRPPGAKCLVSPYDSEARNSVKRDTAWAGYKVDLTETCEQDAPNLITNVVTTDATVPDVSMTDPVHARLAERPVRTAVGTSSVTVSVLYLVAQMVGAGSLVALLLGGTSDAARSWTVVGVGALMVIYVSFGGVRATAWIQIVKAVLLMAGALALTVLVLVHFHGNINTLLNTAAERSGHGEDSWLPGLRYGGDWTSRFDFISLGVALVLGTAGLPHILSRFYTVPTARAARGVGLVHRPDRQLLPDDDRARVRRRRTRRRPR
ncbi:Cation/acetate symporter ActP [Streptomyces badius]